MATSNAITQVVSPAQRAASEQDSPDARVEHGPASRSQCPECDGDVVTQDEESFCADCGVIVAAEWVDRSPTLVDLGMVGDASKSIETVNPLRTDKGLHTKFSLGTDGYGNSLSDPQRRKFRRLRKRHRRYQFGAQRKRTKRLNEGLRDVEMIGGNLALPDHVVETAAKYLREASAARLPGGRMAWESLAGGAVLLAARTSGLTRSDIDVAIAANAKATHERVCAAARKIRCGCGVDAPPVRPNATQAVVDALDDALRGGDAVRIWRMARQLLTLGDDVPVGPGTPRLTVAAAAVYAADRLTSGKSLTQQQVADAASTVVPTTKSKIARYNCKLVDAYVARHGTEDPNVVLEREPAAPA
ncbi:transcription initiation factor TFIIB [Halomicrobium zhouii]|uniref:Transcription initiation factor TFIIB n=1 Tax=Halomicrobium zhouii TaxID=767519 RepID=A0A1I6M2J8_9EURY|nr:transcription factor TFIIB [Halomicrobium zhouii]SFS09884.1 transcription initiation factor TFIIB [Halomicrobium zhouii]